ETPLLILVGDLETDSYLSSAASVRAGIAAHGLADRIRLPGYVSDEALACLCSAATAVVIPSLAEGFGLPAVEAAACGAPLLLSELPAHRETLGDAACYFAPRDVRGLRSALELAFATPGLGERARLAVADLSWDETARRLRDAVHRAAAR